jgi:predicted nucleic acid-binding protein
MPRGAWAEGVLAAGSLQAPELARVEAGNVLRRLERAQGIATAQVDAACDDLVRLHVESSSFDPSADRIRELRRAITSCDAWYVAVAEALQLPLATLAGG